MIILLDSYKNYINKEILFLSMRRYQECFARGWHIVTIYNKYHAIAEKLTLPPALDVAIMYLNQTDH